MKICHFTVPAKSNAGDLLLSHSVRKVFEHVWGPQEWTIKHVRSYIKPEELKKINDEHDLIVVGGGGLFLCDTNKNDNSGWQWNCKVEAIKQITKPFILFGVGYNRFRGQKDFDPIFKKHLQEMKKRCIFMGLRNTGSIDCVSKYIPKDKLVFQPCSTTLVRELYNLEEDPAWNKGDKTIGFTVAFDRKNLRFKNKEGQSLSAIDRTMRWCQKKGWDVQIINQHDADMNHPWLKDQAKKFKVIDTCHKKPEEVVKLYNDIALLVGMRGHSQLIPFGTNNAFISIISHNKLQYFLDDINQPEWGVEVTDSNLSNELIGKIQTLDDDREKVTQLLSKRKDLFWCITKMNLNCLKNNIQLTKFFN